MHGQEVVGRNRVKLEADEGGGAYGCHRRRFFSGCGSPNCSRSPLGAAYLNSSRCGEQWVAITAADTGELAVSGQPCA